MKWIDELDLFWKGIIKLLLWFIMILGLMMSVGLAVHVFEQHQADGEILSEHLLYAMMPIPMVVAAIILMRKIKF